MSATEEPLPNACCASAAVCVFAKALLTRAAGCELAARRSLGEQQVVECTSVLARTNCTTLSALLRERARFALRLPGPSQPLMHSQALRLQCAGLQALQQALDAPHGDVHQLVGAVHQRLGSLTELPWDDIVHAIAHWQPRRRSRPAAP